MTILFLCLFSRAECSWQFSAKTPLSHNGIVYSSIMHSPIVVLVKLISMIEKAFGFVWINPTQV